MIFLLNKKLSFLREILSKIKVAEIKKYSAALSFYATYAIAPILVILISLSSLIFDQGLVETRLLSYFDGKTGGRGVLFIQELLTDIKKVDYHLTFSFIGIFVTFYGLSHFFSTLKESFFKIFGVSLGREKDLRKTFRNYIESFFFTLYLTFLIFVLILISIVVPIMLSFSADLSGLQFFNKSQMLNVVMVFVLTSLLLSLMYKTLSVGKIIWSNALIGGMFSAVLLSFLNVALAWYLNTFHTASAIYGVFGSFIALLLWIYYSIQILLIGAVVANMITTDQVVSLK